MATSVGSALHWWARTKGDHTALVFGEDTVDYRTLRDWSGAVARSLHERGVAEGDRVGLLGGNTPEWAAVALGVMKAGAVLVPLNPRLVGAELHKLLQDSGARVVVADPQFAAMLDQARELGSSVETIPLPEFAALRGAGHEEFRIDRDPAEPVALLFTSGSTGLSKGVICTNRTLLDIVFEASLCEEGLRPGGSSLLLLPLCFTPGLVWGLVMQVVLGGTLVVEAQLDPSRAVRQLDRHKIETIFGVPLIYEVMAKAPEFADADLSHLKTAVVGGAAVSVPLLEAWGSKGVKLRQIYGMTEAGGVATATWPSEADTHPDSCGSGSAFTEIKVVRSDGSECDPGEQGEVLLKGPGVSPGYWQDPETTARAFRDGWLHSGDLGVRDAEGRLTFVDRMKDLIISGGINISPVEIEAVISRIPGVREVSVIAAKDDRFGETPAAIVTADDGVTEAAIIEVCGAQMADYKVPRYVVLRRDDLPRLPSGKISKRAIRDEYSDVSERYAKVR
ncbi:AMP-binding protein [Pseudonocardia sp. RS11V-5]|uniref:class I adenylate-forming enzyme family protein n=1 Tax=Pseudonocardia terrae TaxID=2905831 RepID=UPI001E34FF28|nr:AMP-binding protein [Pseudonocardia terrae]MCE3550827.1 AMP-binding protein [Pseudonocardia terrae]